MIWPMATVAHPAPTAIVPLPAPAIAVAPWVLEAMLMVIVTVVSVAAFSVGYQVG